MEHRTQNELEQAGFRKAFESGPLMDRLRAIARKAAEAYDQNTIDVECTVVEDKPKQLEP